MDLSLINPYIRLATHSVIPKGNNIMQRSIYDYELIYLKSGEFTFIYDNRSYHCKAGDLIFIRPRIPHSFQIEHTEISQPHIHFDITYRLQSEKIPVSFKDIPAMTETEKSWIHKDYFSFYAPVPFVNVANKSDFLKVFLKFYPKMSSLL